MTFISFLSITIANQLSTTVRSDHAKSSCVRPTGVYGTLLALKTLPKGTDIKEFNCLGAEDYVATEGVSSRLVGTHGFYVWLQPPPRAVLRQGRTFAAQ